MKLTFFLLTAAFLNVSARGLSQNVTIDASNAPLETVFRSIEKQTKCTFFYQLAMLKTASKVTLHLSNVPLKQALDQALAGQPFTWAMDGPIITLEPRSAPRAPDPAPAPDAVQAPTVDISGMVLGENNIPLSGATVTVKSTQRGANTDEHGLFQLKAVPERSVLVISSIGYARQEITVMSSDFIRIYLKVASSILDEAVVQAYGTTSRRYATGNIATVSSKDIEKQPVMNPLLAMQGLVPGLVITPLSSSYPSGIIKVELRGRNSLNSSLPSDPLYIIDGVPLSVVEVGISSTTYQTGSSGFIQNNVTGPAHGQNPLFSLNPLDIESISVLKDAEATAIYGARAANGVILITTKKGNIGKTNLDINVNHGTSFVTRHWDLLDLPQYLAFRNEAFANGGRVPTAANAPDLKFWDTTRYTDWQKYIWGHQGQTTQAQLGLSGGEGQTSFRIGAGYQRQNDISVATGANQRVAFSANIQHHSRDRRLSVDLQSNYSYAWLDETTISGVATLAPDAPPVFNAQGHLNWTGWGTAQSSFLFGTLLSPFHSKTNLLTTSLSVGYNVLKGLTLKVRAGYNNAEVNTPSYSPIAAQNPAYNPTGSYTLGNNKTNNWVAEPQAEYNRFIGKGRLNILVGGSLQSTVTDATTVTGSGYTDDILIRNLTDAPYKSASENYGIQKYSSEFGRIGYNWEGKYILSLDGRRDGSSLFGPGNQFGEFGAAGVAWIASEEKWMRKVLPAFVSFFKLRGSYGTTGSSSVSPYLYLTQWSAGYSYTYNGIAPNSPQGHSNPDYHWQINRKLDVSLDLGFLNDRINVNADYYRNRCDNQLLSENLPAFTGFSSVGGVNIPADVQNSGFEFTVSARAIDKKNFKWTSTFNIAINRNKLLAFPNLANSSFANTYRVGKPLNLVYLLQYTGVDKQTGLYTYNDRNQDGRIYIDYLTGAGNGDDDRSVFLNLDPKFTGGWGNTFSYKGLSLNALFYFKKQRATNAFYGGGVPGQYMNNISTWQLAHTWHKPGDNAEFAKFNTNYDISYSYFTQSTGAYTDASFLRLSNLTLSYNLPEKLVRRAGMSNCSINVNTNNIFTITSYKGLDPETQSFGSLPPVRIITAGINCSF